MERRLRVRLLTPVVVLLSAYGIYECMDASIAALKGGTHDFGGIFDYPLWALAHFAGGFVFMVLMPFQFWERFRNRHRTLHRRTGRLLFAAGLTIAISSLPLPYVMPSRPVSEKVFMTTFALVFPFFLTKAVLAARNRDFAAHREWMIRVVAAAFAPLLNRLIIPVFIIVRGVHSLPEFWEYFVTSAWLSSGLTLSMAEWWIRSTATTRWKPSDAIPYRQHADQPLAPQGSAE